MPVLARKIARAKWEEPPGFASGAIGADAVTVDLKSTGNTLSFWRCDSHAPADLERAALALAAGSGEPERLDLVFLDEGKLRAGEFDLADRDGNTPVVALRHHHVDLENLDLDRLVVLARMVAEAHRTGRCHTFSKMDVIRIVSGAVQGGSVAVSDLRDAMRSRVEATLRGPPAA